MPDWIIALVAPIAGAAGVYAAIRSDLAYLRAKAEGAAESATWAHRRIDDYFQNHQHNRRGER